MNIHQKNLLKLVKEIDAFCRKHDITYYCAGGTVIGAARHSGFIPWDDDIDIYMKRKDFLRFAEAFRNDPPQDRTFEYYEGNHEHQTMVARYHEEGTTMFCHYNLFGYSSAGAMIDVFVLDPIPDDYEERCRYIAGLYAYSDLVSPSLCYSHRLPLEHFDIYDEARRIMKEESREAAVQWVSDQIFRYEEDECSCWCLRWGSVPLIYPMDVIGEPVYLPFEDTQVPVPQNWYEYLVVHYGANWMELPYVEYQRSHNTIVNYEEPYDSIYKMRDSLYTQDYLLDLHFSWKDAMRDQVRTERPMEEFAADLQNRICLKTLEKNLAKAGASSLKELYDEKRYDDVISVMDPYIRLQTHYIYMGELMRHGSQYHWMFPLIVPIPDEDLGVLLHSLLRAGNIRPAEKLVDLHIRGNVCTPAVMGMKALFDEINRAAKIYYRGDLKESAEKIRSIEDHEQIPMLRDYLWLATAGDLSEEAQKELQRQAGAELASDGVRKAWGDCLWSSGRKQEAEEVYMDLFRTCRNGLFWNDIRSKNVDIPEIPTEMPTGFRHTDVTARQQELLNEVIDICENNGIDYVLGSQLSRRMFMTGNIGYENGNRRIMMTADSAARFEDAFAREHTDDRRLLSWDRGDELTDFVLLYSDKDSVYCDMRRLEQWRGLGVYVTIRILRREDAPQSYKRQIYYKEFLQNLISLEPLDMRKLKTGKKRAAYNVMKHTLTEGQKNRFRRRLFAKSMKQESGNTSGNYYYWRNERGDRPVKRKVPGGYLRDTTTVEMDGRTYVIPSAATLKHFPREPSLSNRIPRFSIYFYRSDDMTWKEIEPLLDEKKYAALDWEGLARARKRTRDIEQSVRRSWRMIRKIADEREFEDMNESLSEQLKAAFDANDIGEAAVLLEDVDRTVKRGARRQIPVYLPDPLKTYYLRFLKETDQEDIAEAVQELWDMEPSEFFNRA